MAKNKIWQYFKKPEEKPLPQDEHKDSSSFATGLRLLWESSFPRLNLTSWNRRSFETNHPVPAFLCTCGESAFALKTFRVFGEIVRARHGNATVPQAYRGTGFFHLTVAALHAHDDIRHNITYVAAQNDRRAAARIEHAARG